MDKAQIKILLEAVHEATDRIMEVYNSDFDVIRKSDHSPVTIADQQSSKIITNYLSEFGFPIVSEEEDIPEYSERKKHNKIWLVDPLDGTYEFVKRRGEFCICIALINEGSSEFGMIADPINRQVIFGGENMGSFQIPYEEEDFLNERFQLKMDIPPQKGLVYSRSHFSEKVLGIVKTIEDKYGKLEVVRKGSALKFFDLVNNRAQFYPRLAPTMEWDIAAGQAIYEGIGGEVLDFINFERLQYNKESLYNPYFIAKPKELSLK